MATSSFTPTGPTLAGPLTTDDRLVVEAGQALDVTGLVLVGAVSDAGSLSVPASSTLEVARSGATEQSIDLSGRMEVAGTVRVDNGQALVASQGELVLAGGYFGPPVMDAGSTIMVPSYAQNPSIKVEGLVHGYGVMGAGREFSRGPALYGTIENLGTIVADAPGHQLSVAARTFTNTGVLEAGSGSTLDVLTTSFMGAGTLIVRDHGQLLAGAGVNPDSHIILDGPDSQMSGHVFFMGARFTLEGHDQIGVNGYNGVINRYGLTQVGTAGSLELLNGRDFHSVNTIADNGSILLGGGDFDSAGLTVGATGSFAGHGSLGGTVVNNGTITAQGGTLVIDSASLTGTGGFAIQAGAELSLGDRVADNAATGIGTLGTDVDIRFLGATGTLSIEEAGDFHASVAGFGIGNRIDLMNESIGFGMLNADGTASLYGSGAQAGELVAVLSMKDLRSGHFVTVTGDGHGGTLVGLSDSDPGLVHMVQGGAGDDRLSLDGHALNHVDGGDGHDRLVLGAVGLRGSEVAIQADGTLLLQAGGAAAVLRDVEEVRFADGRMVFDLHDPAAEVMRLYGAALGRSPDPAGLNHFIDALDGGQSLAGIAAGFLNSREFALRYGSLDDTGFVTRLYGNVLGRAPDAEGLSFHITNLAHGMSREELLVSFSESQENIARTAPVVQAGIWDADETAMRVARLYDATFGRHPDAGGLQFWADRIESGALALAGVARGFEGSAEFQASYAGLDNAGFVTRLYQNALHRAPDAGGLANWTANLDAHVLSRAEVLLAFSESAEHQMLTADLTGSTSGHGIAFA